MLGWQNIYNLHLSDNVTLLVSKTLHFELKFKKCKIIKCPQWIYIVFIISALFVNIQGGVPSPRYVFFIPGIWMICIYLHTITLLEDIVEPMYVTVHVKTAVPLLFTIRLAFGVNAIDEIPSVGYKNILHSNFKHFYFLIWYGLLNSKQTQIKMYSNRDCVLYSSIY